MLLKRPRKGANQSEMRGVRWKIRHRQSNKVDQLYLHGRSGTDPHFLSPHTFPRDSSGTDSQIWHLSGHSCTGSSCSLAHHWWTGIYLKGRSSSRTRQFGAGTFQAGIDSTCFAWAWTATSLRGSYRTSHRQRICLSSMSNRGQELLVSHPCSGALKRQLSRVYQPY